MKKLIIIPAYNEEANIEKTVAAIQRNAEDFDYVIINDCSTDRTREICEEHGYNIVNLPINLGIGGAVQTGYKYARKYKYDMAVQVDGDGQHDPEFLNVMAEYIEKNQVDMVIGSRFIEKKRISVIYRKKGGYKVLFMADKGSYRSNNYRSYFGFANGRKKCYSTICQRLSKRLSGTRKCCCCSKKRHDCKGNTGSYA